MQVDLYTSWAIEASTNDAHNWCMPKHKKRPVTDRAVEAGRRIRFFREQMGWTQEELADRLGCSQAAVGNYEQGTRLIEDELAIALEAISGQPAPYWKVWLNPIEANAVQALRTGKDPSAVIQQARDLKLRQSRRPSDDPGDAGDDTGGKYGRRRS